MKIFLDTKETSIFLRRSPVTIKAWRWKKVGPKWTPDPFGKPMYALKDLEAWVETEIRKAKIKIREAELKKEQEMENNNAK